MLKQKYTCLTVSNRIEFVILHSHIMTINSTNMITQVHNYPFFGTEIVIDNLKNTNLHMMVMD
jgi:hypothetical protein